MTIIFQLNAACTIQTHHSKPQNHYLISLSLPIPHLNLNDDKEDDDHPWIFKSPSGRVETGKNLAFLKQKLLLPTAGNRAAKTAGRVEPPTAGNRAAKTAR
jgi:hypothetical protein